MDSKKTPLPSKTRRKKVFITRKTRQAPSRTVDRALRTCSRSSSRKHHTSTTKTRGLEDSCNRPQHTMTPYTMQALDDAISQLKRGKAADMKGVNADIINTPLGESTHTHYDCTTSHQRHSKNRQHTGGIRRSKSLLRARTHRHHPTSDLSVRSPFGTRSSASSSSNAHNTHAHKTPVSLLAKQASDQATPRPTCTHSSNSDGEPPSRTSHFGSQTLTYSTQLSRAAYGRLCENNALRSLHTD